MRYETDGGWDGGGGVECFTRNSVGGDGRPTMTTEKQPKTREDRCRTPTSQRDVNSQTGDKSKERSVMRKCHEHNETI